MLFERIAFRKYFFSQVSGINGEKLTILYYFVWSHERPVYLAKQLSKYLIDLGWNNSHKAPKNHDKQLWYPLSMIWIVAIFVIQT